MKISFIVPEISRTGGMRVIFEYANRLSEKGHEVTLYSPYIPFNYYKGQVKPYYIKYRYNYARGFLKGTRKPPDIFGERKFNISYHAFINNLTVGDGDAVIATSWPTAFTVNKLSGRKGRKFYLIQDYEIWNSNIKYVNKSYTLPLNRITVSGYLKDLLLNKFGVESYVILNGIDYNIFNNPGKQFTGAKQLVFMDHSLENKNAKGAITIVKKLYSKYPELKFTCFGYRKYNEMPGYITFHENLKDEEIVQLFRQSDIFLYAAKHEGFGLPPAEAMACKCALVGNAVAAIPEFAKHMESAMLADPDKPEELIEGVSYLVENSSELQRISLNGENEVKEKLNWGKSADMFEEIIKAG